MGSDGDALQRGAQMLAKHRATPYPPRLRGEEIAGVEMILLDAGIAGCVHAWLDWRGMLDTPRLTILKSWRQDLDTVLPLLTGIERAYFEHLREMADLVLEGLKLQD